MSWREFMVLLRGLGPHSAVVWTQSHRGGRDSRGQEVRVLQTTEEAERVFGELFGPKKERPDA